MRKNPNELIIHLLYKVLFKSSFNAYKLLLQLHHSHSRTVRFWSIETGRFNSLIYFYHSLISKTDLKSCCSWRTDLIQMMMGTTLIASLVATIIIPMMVVNLWMVIPSVPIVWKVKQAIDSSLHVFLSNHDWIKFWLSLCAQNCIELFSISYSSHFHDLQYSCHDRFRPC